MLENLIERAENGDARAQCNLGLCYKNGEGVTQDFYEAVKWFRKAAAQGNADAQFNLGWCYFKGEGVTQNYSEGVKWYRKAAEQGHVNAQGYLAASYVIGLGVKEDIGEAIRWYTKAAEQGCKNAKSSLDFIKFFLAPQSILHPRKDDWKKILQVLNENDVHYFYHFTDKENIPSIKKHGGLYSWHYCEKHNITIPYPGGDNMSRELDCKYNLEDYVRLSFCGDHPMIYRLEENEGYSIRVLRIKIDVALWKDTLFSNMNATDRLHTHGGELEHLKNVHFAATQRNLLSNNDPDFKYHQAEVLVKTFIPLEYIENI